MCANRQRMSLPFSALVRRHFASIFASLLPLHSHGTPEEQQKAGAVLQMDMLSAAELTEDERDTLIRNHMVRVSINSPARKSFWLFRCLTILIANYNLCRLRLSTFFSDYVVTLRRPSPHTSQKMLFRQLYELLWMGSWICKGSRVMPLLISLM